MHLGVVCLHGLGGTPHSVLPITAAVHAAGYATVAPTLPGHGTHPDQLVDTSWTEWLDAADATVTELRRRCTAVALIGQSMGGTIALQLATRRDDIVGVAAINPVVAPADPDTVEFYEHLIERGRTMQPAGDADLRDPNAHDTAYAELPVHALLQLMHGGETVAGLAHTIAVPVLLAISAHDNVVDPTSTGDFANSLYAPLTRVGLPRSGHVAALDLDRDLLCRELLTWLADLTDGSAAPV